GTRRLDQGGMESDRERPAGQVLFTDTARTPSVGARGRELGTTGGRDFLGRPPQRGIAVTDRRWVRRVTLRVRTLCPPDRGEQELHEEFQFHIDKRIEMEMAKGLSPEDARSAALRAMDGMEQNKEECRDMRRVNYIDHLLRDLRYAGRNLLRSPSFTPVAIAI